MAVMKKTGTRFVGWFKKFREKIALATGGMSTAYTTPKCRTPNTPPPSPRAEHERPRNTPPGPQLLMKLRPAASKLPRLPRTNLKDIPRQASSASGDD